MKAAKLLVSRFVKGEEGVSMIEYGLLAALIAVVCVAIIGTLGTDLKAKFQVVDTNLK
jgi:pilus assembly protein Flp/PilA